MNNIQKAFKNKARRGLCMADGGILDPLTKDAAMPPQTGIAGILDSGNDALNAERSARWRQDDLIADAQKATSRKQGVFEAAMAQPTSVGAGLSRNPLPAIGLSDTDALNAERSARWRQNDLIGGAMQTTGRKQGIYESAIRRLSMAEGGIVRGPGGPTDDEVPMNVNGRDVNLSNTEAVLPARTVRALGGPKAVEELIESTNGKPPVKGGLRAGGEYANGVVPYNPVIGQAGVPYSDVRDPTYSPPRSTTPVQDGVKMGEPATSRPNWTQPRNLPTVATPPTSGPLEGEFTRTAQQVRPAPVAGTNSSPEAAALRERLASPEGNAVRTRLGEQATAKAAQAAAPQAAQAAAPQAAQAAAPRAAPIAPDMVAPEPAAPRSGILGRVANAADKAKSFFSGGTAPAAEAAAEAAPKWYQPSAGIRSAGNLAAKVAGPLMAADAVYSANKGFAAQNNRDADNIDARGGFAASAAKDAAPWTSAVAQKIGTDAARVGNGLRNSLHSIAPNLVDEGTVNPNTGKREGLWAALTTLDGGPNAQDFHAANTADTGNGQVAAAATAPVQAKTDPKVAAAAGQVTKDDPEDNPNIQALRANGVEGGVYGDFQNAQGKTSARGIRTIQTANGPVFAGRDANGRLNVTSGLDRSAADNEALRAKEAARMVADQQRQVGNFDRLRTLSDLQSNDPRDIQRGMARAGLRQQDINADIAKQHNLLTARGQDMQLQGHQIDAGARMAQLKYQQQQQQQTQNRERFDKMLDEQFGKADPKNDPAGAEKRQQFTKDIFDAYAELGMDAAQMPPKELSTYRKVWENLQAKEPGTARKLFYNYILGTPYVRDANVLRNGIPVGDANAIGYSRNANGTPISAIDAVDGNMITGERDAMLERIIAAQRRGISQ